MWDLIVLIPDQCLSVYSKRVVLPSVISVVVPSWTKSIQGFLIFCQFHVSAAGCLG